MILLDLEFVGGLRESADLRKQNFIPAQVVKTVSWPDGPLKLCSRSATTAAKKFAVLIFWFVLHQGKMNECNNGMGNSCLKSTNAYYMGNVRETGVGQKVRMR